MDAPDPVLVTLLRHGESESNRQGRWQGQGDSPLSELGREQAARAGARLARRPFHRVIASDLQRASDTASATGLNFDRDPVFRELDVGRWEGLTREEVDTAFPEEIARLRRGEDIPLGGGESYAQFVARVEAGLEAVVRSMDPGQHLLVVCHGGVIGALVSVALGIRERGHWPISRVSNTAVTELAWQPGRAQLQVFNDDLHLEGMPSSEADLVLPQHEVGLADVGEDFGRLSSRFAGVPVYRLPDWPAEGVTLPPELVPFQTEAVAGAGLEAWLQYAATQYHGRAARCLAASSALSDWLASALSLPSGAAERLGPPRAGTWSRLRGAPRPVLLRYNADPSR